MSLLHPSSIAVIGASAQEGKVGHDVLKNLLTQGFAGRVYPVNPKGGEILGHAAFASVTGIPETIDLAVIVTPAATVSGLLRECAEKQIQNVIIITAGFGETATEQGKTMEKDIRNIAKEHGMRLVGVNCLGLLRPSIGLNASFAKDLPPAGGIALISQSGALAVGLMDEAPDLPMGFSFVASIGNKTVMDECDFLEMALEDGETKAIGLYLESIRDGRRFLNVSAKVAAQKPIVLLKSGRSAHGKTAAASHTGALAGSDAAIDALCAQTGMQRAENMEHCLDLLRVLSTQPPLLSNQIAIVTNAGGPGILATDAAESAHLTLPPLTTTVDAVLKKSLPPAASTHNPIDVLGDAGADRYGAALTACGSDPAIDGICALLTPQVMTPCTDIARALIHAREHYPLMPIVAGFIGGKGIAEATKLLGDHGIPSFETPERAIRAIASLTPQRPRPGTGAAGFRESSTPSRVRHDQNNTEAIALLQDHKGLLSEDVTEHLLQMFHLPLPRQALARTPEEAATIATKLGFPLIAKISSPDILHKTDIGGVCANIQTTDEAAEAVRAIEQNIAKNAPDARVRGVMLQEFLPVGREFIVGSVRDPSFGPLIMVGLGGIYTELFADTAFRLTPLAEEDAYGMLQELKAWRLLLGMRGMPQADINALVELIQHTADMVTQCPRIKELDFNPVRVDAHSVKILDAKVVVE